jgi:Holliday junction resolvasome RuvABC endonuclease subunit
VSPRIVALDLSLTGTGVAWSHSGLGNPYPGARTIRPRSDGHERIADIALWIGNACLCLPDLVVIERLPLVKGTGDTALGLAELHGVVKQQLWEHGYPYVLVHPSRLKQYATGKGSGPLAAKPLVTQAARRRYRSVHLADHNAADAFVLLAMAADWYGHPLAPVPDTHRRALDKVPWPALNSPAVVVDA